MENPPQTDPKPVTTQKNGEQSVSMRVDGEELLVLRDKAGNHAGIVSTKLTGITVQKEGVNIYHQGDAHPLHAARTLKTLDTGDGRLPRIRPDFMQQENQDTINHRLNKEIDNAVARVFKDNYATETEMKQLNAFRKQVVAMAENGMDSGEINKAITLARNIKGSDIAR